ncbi:MAG: PocR ligand-binding domain-containing protein [Eubacteriales bacterium]
MGVRTELTHLVSEDLLLKILSTFSSATGLRAIIIDREGYPRVPLGFQEGCTFCRVIHDDPVGRNKCRGSYARAGKQAAQFGEPYIFRCHAGLVAFAAPIVTEGNHIASIICGQVLMWEPEDFFWEEIVEMTSGLNINTDILISAAEELEVISGIKVQAAADLLFVVANQIMQSGMLALQQRKEIAWRQTQLSEEIRARKDLEKKLAEVEGGMLGGYSLHKERELTGMVRIADREGAYRILNELISEIMEKYISQPRIFKVRVLELLVVLSRSAAEGGADLKELLNLNYQYIEEISRTEEVDELCNWIFKVMDSFVELVYGITGVKYTEIIEAATQYIRKHYDQNLTINEIARVVYISPYYLSHIFKEHLNCTLIDYLTKVRMEQAKKLLRNPRLSIVDVAEKIGYNDPGYFSKVFKKTVGISPSIFKKQLV